MLPVISLPNLKTRDIVIGFIVLVILISGVILAKKAKNNNLRINPSPTPSIQSKIQDTFNGYTIPSDEYKVELKDVSESGGFGIATKTEILANLPEPKIGETYEAWLTKDSKLVKLGQMREAKGGWILESDFSNYSGYKIVITLGGKHVLEGSF